MIIFVTTYRLAVREVYTNSFPPIERYVALMPYWVEGVLEDLGDYWQSVVNPCHPDSVLLQAVSISIVGDAYLLIIGDQYLLQL